MGGRPVGGRRAWVLHCWRYPVSLNAHVPQWLLQISGYVRICPCSVPDCPRFVLNCPILSRFVLAGSFEILRFRDKKGHMGQKGTFGIVGLGRGPWMPASETLENMSSIIWTRRRKVKEASDYLTVEDGSKARPWVLPGGRENQGTPGRKRLGLTGNGGTPRLGR